MNSVQKQLVDVLREVAHPDVGVVARIRSAQSFTLAKHGNWYATSGRCPCQAGEAGLGRMVASCCECRIGAGICLGHMVCEYKTSAMRNYERSTAAAGADDRGSGRAQK